MPDEPPSRRGRLLLHLGVLAAATALLLAVRTQLDKAHVTLAYLLVVLVAAADGGRRVGLAAATLAFLAFNWFFLPPYGTLVVADPRDWLVLVAFLATSVVASHLFHRVQQEADDARRRTREVTLLASTGAEAIRAPRAADALEALAHGLCEVLGLAACRIAVAPDAGAPPSLVDIAAAGEAGPDGDAPRIALDRNATVALLPDGITRLADGMLADATHALDGATVTRLVVPLAMRGTTIGTVTLVPRAPLTITPDWRRVAGALLHTVALGADRLQLERTSQHVAALREADRLKNAVLASVSHDLRTPLTTISALAQELGAHGDERADIIAQEAGRLNRFVRDLLDVSRLSSGAMPVHAEVVPIDELVASALQQVEGAWPGREVRVALDPAHPLLLGRFDPLQAARILVNLLENAHKYAPPSTPIDLTVQVRGDRIAIDIADRGPGVAAEERERIFQPLYRPASARPDAGSAGLGLAIARGFAEAQGGALDCAPRAGGGTVFTVTLPLASEP